MNTKHAATLGGFLMVAQLLPLVYNCIVNSVYIPVLTSVISIAGLGLILLHYKKDSFIIALNGSSIIIHIIAQLIRII